MPYVKPVELFSWTAPDGTSGTFRAMSKPKFAYKQGARRFASLTGEPDEFASLFVGWSRRSDIIFKRDIVKFVKAMRVRQVKHQDVSLVYQIGTHMHEVNGVVKVEESMQLVIANVRPMLRRSSVFRKNMVKLAEALCKQKRHERVMIRLVSYGNIETIGVVE